MFIDGNACNRILTIEDKDCLERGFINGRAEEACSDHCLKFGREVR